MGITARVFRLHHLFNSGKALSLHKIMQELEVSKATIKRDLDLLRDELGAPLSYDRYENVYRYMPQKEAFELPGLWFNASELHALLAAEQLLENVQPGLLTPHIGPLKSRIRGLLEKSGHEGDTVASRVILQPMGNRRMETECFGTVAGAALDGQPLDIRYHARGKGEVRLRRVHPLRLLYYRDNWYVIAWCEQAEALRTFSLDRIEKAVPLDLPLRRIDDTTLQHHLNAGFGIFAGQPAEWAVLRFTPRMARWVADEQWHPQQQGRWDGDYYELQIPYADPTELIMDILKYGPDVEVIAPNELRQTVVQRLKETSARYE